MNHAAGKLKVLIRGRFSVMKTLYLNFRAFPFKQAMKLPIAVSGNVKIRGCKKGSIVIKAPAKPLMISLGFGGSPDLTYYNFRRSYLEIAEGSRIEFGGRAHFAPHFTILVRDGSVMRVGNGFSCNNGCKLSCTCGVSFGEHCLLGGDVVVRDSDGHRVFTVDEANGGRVENPIKKPVVIGNHVWICNKSDILKGVTVGDDCIVSYRSLVVKSFEGSNLLIGGSPATILRENIQWER